MYEEGKGERSKSSKKQSKATVDLQAGPTAESSERKPDARERTKSGGGEEHPKILP
jgi:hypothetical protein